MRKERRCPTPLGTAAAAAAGRRQCAAASAAGGDRSNALQAFSAIQRTGGRCAGRPKRGERWARRQLRACSGLRTAATRRGADAELDATDRRRFARHNPAGHAGTRPCSMSRRCGVAQAVAHAIRLLSDAGRTPSYPLPVIPFLLQPPERCCDPSLPAAYYTSPRSPTALRSASKPPNGTLRHRRRRRAAACACGAGACGAVATLWRALQDPTPFQARGQVRVWLSGAFVHPPVPVGAVGKVLARVMPHRHCSWLASASPVVRLSLNKCCCA